MASSKNRRDQSSVGTSYTINAIRGKPQSAANACTGCVCWHTVGLPLSCIKESVSFLKDSKHRAVICQIRFKDVHSVPVQCMNRLGPPEGNIRPHQGWLLPAKLIHSKVVPSDGTSSMSTRDDYWEKIMPWQTTWVILHLKQSLVQTGGQDSFWKGWLMDSDNFKTPGIRLWSKLDTVAKLWRYNIVGRAKD